MAKKSSGRKAYSKKEKDQIRAKIINSAKQLFSEYDFTKVTMEKIAKRSGMVKGNLYYYFKSLGDLYIVMSTQIYKETYLYYNKNIDQNATAKERFLELYRSKFQFFKNNVEYLVITNFLYYNQYQFDFEKVHPDNIEKFDSVINSGHKILENILTDGVKNGEFKHDLNIDHLIDEFAYTSRSILNLTLLNFDNQTLGANEEFYENYVNNLLKILE